MNMKLALLAVVTLVVIGTSAAIAGRDKSPTSAPAGHQSAGMSCCATGKKAPAPAADKDAPAKSGMSCHSTPAAPKSKTAAPKSCCK